MAINYNTGNTTQAQNTVEASDAVSPNINLAGGSGMGGITGITPSEIASQFGSAYQSAEAGYAPFPDSGTQNDINQLQGVYNKIPQAYDVSNTVNLMNQARQASLATGTEAANTAAQKFQTSNIPGAATGVGASVLRAQSLLPYMQSDTQAAQAEGEYQNTASQQALSTAASVADQIAGLQQNYTNSLAAYNSGKAQFGLSYAQGQTGASLAANQTQVGAQVSLATTQAQLAENAREANLSAMLQSQQNQTQAAETSQNQAITAANDILTNPKGAPSGSWTTSDTGQVLSGQSDYNAYQNYLQGRSGATSALAAIA